jgi:hypothetical protein
MGNSEIQGRAHVTDVRAEETPVEATVRAVTTVTGSQQTDLEPLYSAVDTDALNRLFADPPGQSESLNVGFTYEGFAVSLSRSAVRLTERSVGN